MLDPEDFYIDDGLMVLTERYHLKRGWCCGNACRHCPFGHAAVPDASEREIPLPFGPRLVTMGASAATACEVGRRSTAERRRLCALTAT